MAPVVALLHPGSMGAAVGAQLRAAGATVLWCPAGRSEATRRRAAQAGLDGVPLREAVARADVVLSLCDPAAAEDVGGRVAAAGLRDGAVYVEANAISPERVGAVAALEGLPTVVDGAVVGSPPAGGKSPLLYLSGPPGPAARTERLFTGTEVRVRVIGEELGQASALKLVYSVYQKTSRLLAALAYGAADSFGVTDELMEISEGRTRSYLAETDYIPKTAARAWRWAPDLADAGELLAGIGLPAEVVRAAAATLDAWNPERDTSLTVAEALDRLREAGP